MTFLLVTVRFLDDRYHGLLDREGPREWPPSPFRLFCALVAGVARRGGLEEEIGGALAWLQRLDPPIIIAPKSRNGQAIVRFVPNNDGDKPKKLDRKDRLAEKPTMPTLMLLEAGQKPEVHYVWNIEGKSDLPLSHIRDAARSLTALGWGVDMAFADSMVATEAEIQKLPGIRWYPKPGAWRDGGMLRVPTANPDLQECTLCDLKHCHQTAINRIAHGKPLHTVDEPRVFERIFYTSTERPIGRPYRIFELHKTDGSRFRYPHRKLIHIAGMVRHLAIEAMKDRRNWPRDVKDEDWAETYIAGHRKGGKADPVTENKCRDDVDEDRQREVFGGSDVHCQLSYLPLPSVGHEHTDPGVRRVMIAAPVGDDAWLDHVARRLAGQMLKPEPGQLNPFAGREPPLLAPVPQRLYGKGVPGYYTNRSSVWHSVTPVILPGHDDHKSEKTHKLIEKALAQSGIEQPCEFKWSAFSRFPKSFSAHKYDKDRRPQGYIRPTYLNSQTAVHLTLRFHDGSDKKNPMAVPGPIAIGAGRHCGLGLFAAAESS